MKKCPFCAEDIQDDAIKCRYCGEMLAKDGPKIIVNICPQCSKEYDDTWKQCLNCNIPLIKRAVASKKCPYCGTENSINAFKCRNENCSGIFSSSDIAEQIDAKVICPKCGSSSITTVKKGYDTGGGCCGAILFGPLGLLCGATESNKLSNVCQKCGHSWGIA